MPNVSDDASTPQPAGAAIDQDAITALYQVRRARPAPDLGAFRVWGGHIPTTLGAFDEWLKGVVGGALSDVGKGEQSRQFPRLVVGGEAQVSLALSPTVQRELSPPEWPADDTPYPPFPALLEGRTRYILNALVLWSSGDGGRAMSDGGIAAIFTLRPAIDGGLIGEIQYREVVKPWIDALRRDAEIAGVVWREDGAPIAEPPAQPAGIADQVLRDAKHYRTCDTCQTYVATCIEAWEEKGDTGTAAWTDIARKCARPSTTLQDHRSAHCKRAGVASYPPRIICQRQRDFRAAAP